MSTLTLMAILAVPTLVSIIVAVLDENMGCCLTLPKKDWRLFLYIVSGVSTITLLAIIFISFVVSLI